MARPDPGRFALKKVAVLKGAFKTPTLRDIALTAPYMHNGCYDTLEEVVEHYVRGGDVKDNLSANMQPLELSAQEKSDLVEFMRSLTSAPRIVAVPALPRWSASISILPELTSCVTCLPASPIVGCVAPAFGADHRRQPERQGVLDAALKAKVGDTISFRNEDPFVHNIFSLSDVQSFDLGTFAKGETAPGEAGQRPARSKSNARCIRR